jgi:hypothetical protein
VRCRLVIEVGTGPTISCCAISFDKLVDCKHTAFLSRLFNVVLHKLSPLLRLSPVQKDDVARRTASDILYTPVGVHEGDDIPNIIELQTTIEFTVDKQIRVGSLGEGEAEDAVVSGVGEDEVGPLVALGVERGEVCLKDVEESVSVVVVAVAIVTRLRRWLVMFRCGVETWG